MQRLAGVLFAPAQTFADIVRRPDILVPLLLVALITIGASLLIAPKMDIESFLRETYANSPQMKNAKEADIDNAVKMMTTVTKITTYLSPILGIGMLVAIAAVFLGIFRALGGEGTFMQYLSVTLYAWVPQLLKSIIIVIIVYARGEMIRPDGMATILMSHPGTLVDMAENPIAFAVLSSFELFNIWSIILFIIGMALVAKVSRTKAAVVVISLYLVVVLFKIGNGALQLLGKKAAAA
ncbi:MAG TPA: Yip1 family protein [Thermoanaerobaculia bacterium]